MFKLTDILLSVVKCTQFVLLKFKDNWFALSHLFKVVKTMQMFLLRSIRLEWANEIPVSAKIIGTEVLFIILGKSFIYKRKSRGPKIEPCGTPCLTLAQSETSLMFSLSLHIAVLQYLLSRYDWYSWRSLSLIP
jgi:hypothetical protein